MRIFTFSTLRANAFTVFGTPGVSNRGNVYYWLWMQCFWTCLDHRTLFLSLSIPLSPSSQSNIWLFKLRDCLQTSEIHNNRLTKYTTEKNCGRKKTFTAKHLCTTKDACVCCMYRQIYYLWMHSNGPPVYGILITIDNPFPFFVRPQYVKSIYLFIFIGKKGRRKELHCSWLSEVNEISEYWMKMERR